MDLVLFDKAKKAIAEAVSIDEVRDIRNKADAMRIYYKQAGESLTMQNQCAQIKIFAERKIGEILSEIEKNKGGQAEHSSYRSPEVTSRIETLNDLGISKMQSFKYQSIASIPEPIFQDHITSVMSEEDLELTSIGLLRIAKQLKLDEKLQGLRNQVGSTDRNMVNGENKIHCADCVEYMKKMEENSVDLTITSPPYDNLRDLDGDFDFENIARGLYRVTKEGGVVVWVVGDATINGSETGTSFKQALLFMEIGFNLHDTMIYAKSGVTFSSEGRYTQVFEYMFVFSKGKPKTFNPICDEPKLWQGSWGTLSTRNKDGSLTARNLENEGKGSSGRAEGSEYGFKQRTNIWKIRNGHGFGSKDDMVILHPSTFPEQLARDMTISWSNPGDLVFDCMAGSGTTLKVAKMNNRNYLGVDINEEYCRIARQRLAMVLDTRELE
jgi:site-specific DNA-methyltransferase (adenine-specific)